MAFRHKPLDLTQVKTTTVRRRAYRLGINMLASMPKPAESLLEFYRSLPKVGEAAELLAAAELVAQAIIAGKPIVCIHDRALMDAGLSPLLVHMIQHNVVQCLVMNGEAAVRDYELAFFGATVEDVAAGLADGLLGMARETGEGINAIVNEGVKRGFSIGECLGRGILDRQPKHYMSSLLATAAARLTAMTVHVSLGADGFHRHPGADGMMLGKGSLKDMHILSSYLTGLNEGMLILAMHRGETLNEVFLNAFALARNLAGEVKNVDVVRVGEGVPALDMLPGLAREQSVGGALELSLPLLAGALFSLVE